MRRYSDPIKALNALLDAHEGRPDRERDVLVYPDYGSMSYTEAQSFLRELGKASHAGAIAVEMGRRDESHAIKRVRLVDARRLYAYLGRRPAPELSEQATASILGSLGDRTVPEWIVAEIEELRRRWSMGQPYRGLGLGDADDASKLFRLLQAVDGRSISDAGVNWRAFSVHATGDSKALERHAGRIGAIVKEAFELDDVPAEQVLDRLGLAAYPDPVWVRGDLDLVSAGTVVPLRHFRPYAAVPPECVDALACERLPEYVLTIENKASFNEWVRRIDDGGIVVFTGGFPSRAVSALLSRLATTTAGEAAWYHWGDVDLGGLRIFRHLEQTITAPKGIALRPHLMSESLAREHGQPAKPMTGARRLAESDSAIAPLARYLAGLEGNEVHTLEQEGVRPVAPSMP